MQHSLSRSVTLFTAYIYILFFGFFFDVFNIENGPRLDDIGYDS
ncbi:hypothetical protein BH23PLA1_BH23PLA1_12730 [soil metagenome]